MSGLTAQCDPHQFLTSWVGKDSVSKARNGFYWLHFTLPLTPGSAWNGSPERNQGSLLSKIIVSWTG